MPRLIASPQFWEIISRCKTYASSDAQTMLLSPSSSVWPFHLFCDHFILAFLSCFEPFHFDSHQKITKVLKFFIFGSNFIMNTSSCRLNLAPEATVSERRPSSQGAAPSPKFQSSSKFTDQAPSPLNHPPAAGSHDKTPPKSPSRSSTVYSDSAKHQIAREEREIGKAVAVDGNSAHEEALRALEVYAAFQVTLLRELTDDITFNSPHG